MDMEYYKSEFTNLLIKYREVHIFPIESIFNKEKNTAKAISKVTTLEVSEINKNGYIYLTEIEQLIRKIVFEILIEEKVANAEYESQKIIPMSWLASELRVETEAIMYLIESYTLICIEINTLIKNNTSLKLFLQILYNPAKSALAIFDENSTKTNLKILSKKLDSIGTQLYIQLKIVIDKLCSLVDEKLEITFSNT
ncbi:hypothetical protein L2737_05345 [Shewanella electrodiphila]|uniref:Uncharacterized protein n=1 Tax=Shewanella electrodiphila TaxID=934143 RepID=A0ABT0KLY3_9GAMM|nr:hypothetical protein [Shewanella electrodiphila]MCL1044753.1 hypothetical protein [Shewanella electrodiphila]